MELVRALLLKLEAVDTHPGVVRVISPSDAAVAVEGFDAKAIGHHFRMLVSAGYVETGQTWPFGPDGSMVFRHLTWEGHEFLDAVRDPKIWADTKRGAEAAGGFTIDLLKDLAKGFLRKQVEELTGVKL